MRRSLSAVLVACVFALAGCGGTSHPAHTAMGSVHPPGWGAPQPRLLPHVGVSVVPSVQQLDTITPSALAGLNPLYLAGYTAGRWPTFLPLLRAYPHATVKSIAISVLWHAQCLDVEPGDAVPSQAAVWIRADIQAGFKRPCVYSSLWEFVNQVRPDLAHAGISRGSVWEWDADATNVPHIDPGFDGTQYTFTYLGRNIDASRISTAFAGITPPKPKPVPKPLPVCYSHRLTSTACTAAKATVARDELAVAASRRALAQTNRNLAGDHCVRPFRRGYCVHQGAQASVFRQRVRFFSAAAARTRAAS